MKQIILILLWIAIPAQSIAIPFDKKNLKYKKSLKKSDLHYKKLRGSLHDKKQTKKPVDPTKQAELIKQIRKGKKDLAGADLRGANLVRTNLQNTTLNWADFEGAILIRANLRRAYMEHANLRGAKLHGADFEGAILTGADFKGAILTGAKFKGTNLIFAYIDSKYRDMIMASGALNTDRINWWD